MPRTIINKRFEVHCKCDRCARVIVRETDGDISLPVGWSFVHVSTYSNQYEGALLCASCVAIVLAAAAPAHLDLDGTDLCPARHKVLAAGSWCSKCGERIPF